MQHKIFLILKLILLGIRDHQHGNRSVNIDTIPTITNTHVNSLVIYTIYKIFSSSVCVAISITIYILKYIDA